MIIFYNIHKKLLLIKNYLILFFIKIFHNNINYLKILD